jgi:hypothetical protein
MSEAYKDKEFIKWVVGKDTMDVSAETFDLCLKKLFWCYRQFQNEIDLQRYNTNTLNERIFIQK